MQRVLRKTVNARSHGLNMRARQRRTGKGPKALRLVPWSLTRNGISPLVSVLAVGILIIVGTVSVAVYNVPTGAKSLTTTETILFTSTKTSQVVATTTSVVQQTSTVWETSQLNMTSISVVTSTTTSTSTSTSTILINSTQSVTVYQTSTILTTSTVTATTTSTSTVIN